MLYLFCLCEEDKGARGLSPLVKRLGQRYLLPLLVPLCFCLYPYPLFSNKIKVDKDQRAFAKKTKAKIEGITGKVISFSIKKKYFNVLQLIYLIIIPLICTIIIPFFDSFS